jgi:hypothetical protein
VAGDADGYELLVIAASGEKRGQTSVPLSRPALEVYEL